MARLAATASLAVLLLSLLAVASCRVLEAEPDTAVAVSDERGPPSPASDDAAAVVIPAIAAGEGFLRLPSFHRRHRGPCRHGHLWWWARHHGLFHRRGVFPGPDEARVRPGPAVVPSELEAEQVEEEVKAVAEPDPDSRPDTDGGKQAEDDAVEEEASKKPFRGEDAEEENHDALVKAWKGEMLSRFHSHHLHHLRHHHEQDEGHEAEEKNGGDDDHEQGGMKRRFHFHHHRHDEEAETMTTAPRNKRFFHHDGAEEVDEVEELARRLSKAIMKRRFGGRRRHHHHHHAEDGKNEEGGVKRWFKRLVNRF
jgi:hypothetical protein